MIFQQTHRLRTIKIVAAMTVAALIAAACGGDDPEVSETPTPTDTVTTTQPLAPEPEPEPVEAPAPDEDADAQPCPAGEHRHDGEECHGDETLQDPLVTEDEKEPLVDLAPVDPQEPAAVPEPEPVICGEGLVLMEEFVTETDNGCRTAECEGDRTDDGECALVERELTEGEVAELPTETIPYEEYGLEGCTEISPGVCDLDVLDIEVGSSAMG